MQKKSIGLSLLKPDRFKGVYLSPETILEWFQAFEAYWMHDGDPKHPHAQLTKGNCSNGFFDCWRVLRYFNLSEILANKLARQIRQFIGSQAVDVVVGSPMAGITFAHDVGRALGAKIFLLVEKDPDNPKKKICRDQKIPDGANVLQIEELITTAGTTQDVLSAVELMNGGPVKWLPFIGTLIHRPDKKVFYYDDRRVIPVIEKIIWSADPNDCPLCKAGSPRLKPKAPGTNNWDILTLKEASDYSKGMQTIN